MVQRIWHFKSFWYILSSWFSGCCWECVTPNIFASTHRVFVVSQSQSDYKIFFISILGLRLNFLHIFISHMNFFFGGIVHSFALPSLVQNLFFSYWLVSIFYLRDIDLEYVVAIFLWLHFNYNALEIQAFALYQKFPLCIFQYFHA